MGHARLDTKDLDAVDEDLEGELRRRSGWAGKQAPTDWLPLFRHAAHRVEAQDTRTRRRAHALLAAASRGPDLSAEARRALATALSERGVDATDAQLALLAPHYGRGIELVSRGLAAASERGAVDRVVGAMIEHARSHQPAPSVEAPSVDYAAAAVTGQWDDLLDDSTRRIVERTTGETLGNINVRIDPELAMFGMLGAAEGDTIRLSPELPGPEDPLGRRVRVHEAVHLLQFREPAANGVDGDQREVAAEHEAASVTDAAMRGESHDVSVGADPTREHGYSASDALEDLGLDPMSWVRDNAPELAQLIDGGLDGIVDQAGGAVAGLVEEVMSGLGIDEIAQTIQDGFASLQAENLAFGLATGCCSCLDDALAGVMTSLQSFLASDTATSIQSWIAETQQDTSDSTLDGMADFFGMLKELGSPIVELIDAAAAGIQMAKDALGVAGDAVWEYVADALGLDASLSPMDAIKAKLDELWQSVMAELQPFIDGAKAVWEYVKNDSFLAPLFQFVEDLPKLYDFLKALWDEKVNSAEEWLILAREHLNDTVFEPLIDALEAGRNAATAAADAVTGWITGILDQLGILEAWNTTVSFLQAVSEGVRGFVQGVRDMLTAIGDGVNTILAALVDAFWALWELIKPLVDFVAGFVIAVGATMMGILPAIPLFLLSNAFIYLLPDCYKASVLNFCIDVFREVVAWLPVEGDINIFGKAIKAGALSFLDTLRNAPDEQKIGALDMIASLFAGNIEFAAGLFVGIFMGLWDSTIGTIIFLFEVAWWLLMLGPRLLSFSAKTITEILESELGLGVDEEEEVEEDEEDTETEAPVEEELDVGETEPGLDEDGEETPVNDVEPDETEDEWDSGQEEPQPDTPDTEPQPEEGVGTSPDTGGDDSLEPPPTPPDLASGRELFDQLFRHGVSREDLEEIFANLSVSLQESASDAGELVANKMLEALNSRASAYAVGELTGYVLGMVVAELVIIILTWGWGSIKTAITGVKVTLKATKSVQTLLSLLREARRICQPVLTGLQKLKGGLGRWAAAVAKYIDDLIKWAQRTIAKLLGRAKKPKKPKTKKPKTKPDAPDGKKPKPKPKKPKKPKDSATLAALQAAKSGWTKIEAQLGKNVKSESYVKGQVKKLKVKVKKPKGKKIKISTYSSGSTWKVKAKVGSASAKSGSGWISKDEKGNRYFPVKSTASLHQELIKEAYAALTATDKKEQSKDLRAQYDAKVELAAKLRTDGQAEIDKQLKGIKYTIELEPFSGVESDRELEGKLLIQPNMASKNVRLKMKTSVYLGAKRVSGTIKGSFGHKDWTWTALLADGSTKPYPSATLRRHPVNEFYSKYGCQTSTSSPKPSGDFEIGGNTKGVDSSEWKTFIEDKKNAHKAGLPPGTANAEVTAKRMTEQEYVTLGWPLYEYPDLRCLNQSQRWQGHHIHPINWEGKDLWPNIVFVPLDQHDPYTKWFDTRKRELEDIII